MLNFDTHVKNSDAAQPRVTNVKTPIGCIAAQLSARYEDRVFTLSAG